MPDESLPDSRFDRFAASLLERDETFSNRLRIPETCRLRRIGGALLAHSGDSWFWLAGLFIVWLASAGEWRLRSAMLAGGILAMAALVMGIKLLVRRKRPSGEWGMLYRSTDPHSFPSGHAARVALLAVMAWGLGPAWFAVVLTLWAPLVALARVRMGVHYLSDVIVGMLLGIAGGLLALTLQPLLVALVPWVFYR